jgi:hypothetical protein
MSNMLRCLRRRPFLFSCGTQYIRPTRMYPVRRVVRFSSRAAILYTLVCNVYYTPFLCPCQYFSHSGTQGTTRPQFWVPPANIFTAYIYKVPRVCNVLLCPLCLPRPLFFSSGIQRTRRTPTYADRCRAYLFKLMQSRELQVCDVLLCPPLSSKALFFL